MTSQLLLVSIGPVQDFIATARQCQDLWYGSHLLSELSKAAANALHSLNELHTQGSATLIFPAGLGGDGLDELDNADTSTPRSVANKILTQLSPKIDAREAAQRAQDSVRQRLQQEVGYAFGKIKDTTYFQRDTAQQQISFDELIEFMWATAPLEDDSDEGYARARDSVERTLAAVKASKQWGQPSWNPGQGVPKSSLDGVRESVIHEDAYEKTSPDYRRRVFKVKASERLCGVGLLKRLGADLDLSEGVRRPTFHSTSHVAAAPHLCALTQHNAHAALRELLTSLSELQRGQARAESYQHLFRVQAGRADSARLSPPAWHPSASRALTVPRVVPCDKDLTPAVGVDGYLLYPERAHDILERLGVGLEHEAALQTQQRALLRALESSEPHAYYAVLLADGDRMGAALDALKGLSKQQTLGRHLNRFADQCGELVAKYAGSLIYAGGDDVLALCPLHTALECASELRSSFDDHMRAFEEELAEAVEGYKRPTLSVGLALMHHLDAMSEALSAARDAERSAKLAGRNALSIKAVPRGGSPYLASGTWPKRADDHRPEAAHYPTEGLVERLHAWMGWLASGELPRGISHELLHAAELFDDRQGFYRDELSLNEPFMSYVHNIIKMKRSRGGDREAGQAPIEALKARFEGITSARARWQRVTEVAHELEIARLFKRAYEVAWGSASQKESK